MKPFLSSALALCLCLCLAAPALAQFSMPQPKPLPDANAATAPASPSATAPATGVNPAGWTTVTKLGVTFSHPSEWGVINDDMGEYAVGLLDQASNKGAGFGLVVDNPDDLVADLKSDAVSFADLGPVTVSGMSGTLYEGLMDDGTHTGAVRLIALDQRSPDESGLGIMMSVVGQDYAKVESVFQTILDSTVVDPTIFGPANDTSDIFISNEDASIPDPTTEPPGLTGPTAPPVGTSPIPDPVPVDQDVPPLDAAPDGAPTPDAALAPDATPALPAPPPSTADTSGWTQTEHLGCTFLYPPDFEIVEQDDVGIAVGRMAQDQNAGAVFGLAKDDAESMKRDMSKDSDSFEDLGQVEISGYTGTLYRAKVNSPEDQMVGVAELIVLDGRFADEDSLLIMMAVVNVDWDQNQPTLERIKSTLVLPQDLFAQAPAEEDTGGVDAAATRTGSLELVEVRSFRDMVGRNEDIGPDGSPDARFKLTIQGPGTIVAMRMHNMDGQHSEWNSFPGDGNWALAVYQGKTLVSSEADGSVRAVLSPGENKLDIFVQDNNAIAGGKTSFELLVTFEDGSVWQAMAFPN